MTDIEMTEELRLVARLLGEAYTRGWSVVSRSRRADRPRTVRAWGIGPQALGTLTAESRQVVLTADGTLMCRVPSDAPGNLGWRQTRYISRVTVAAAINALCDEGILPASWHTAYAAGAAAAIATMPQQDEAPSELLLTAKALALLAEGVSGGA